ncbi:Na(+)/H(+) antiporter subunit D [Thermodesulfovibrionales bacterium]|nr:Na(+)/H(+) antiporter subunit D [Thermodesulfovibrionales bacterium]MCL0061506.1 Na(+)/H(+) antiporter subunit D [Thermodesulfovibrionales bacterium]
MIDLIPPGFVFIFGAILLPLLKGRVRQAYLLLLPILAYLSLLNLPEGTGFILKFIDYELILLRVDKVSMIFGHIFVIMAFIGFVYAIHLKGFGEHIAASLYIGSSLGVVFAGDLITFFIFWEIMALSSTYLIWARKTKASYNAGFRYIVIHILGGLALLMGIIMHVAETGCIAFNLMELTGLSSYLILIGFILNAAVPPFSAWLSDAYPEATVTGAVFLSAFTTKTAVYALIRAFPDTELLAWAGAIMTLYGVIFAVLANDIRRLLAYHIISQVGFMVAGVGIGTALALDGSAAHAFAHILYKGLLFMGAGAVLYMTGKSKLSDLGGLYKTMPITLILFMVGALSISGFPLFSGFVSKSLIVTAAAKEDLTPIWLLFSIASSGTWLSIGLKLAYFAWFGEDSGIRTKEPPINMLIAMGIASFLCIFIGIYPDILYALLPFESVYVPFTAEKIVWKMQFLFFTALGFFMLLKYLRSKPYIFLDTDLFYRKGAMAFMWFLNNPLAWVGAKITRVAFEIIPSSAIWLSKDPATFLKITSETALLLLSGHEKRVEIEHEIEKKRERYPHDLRKHWTIGPTVFWTVFIFFLITLIYFFLM